MLPEIPLAIDDFLPDPDAVRAHALACEFIDWPGPDGETYKRVCLTEVPDLRDTLESAVGPVDMLGMGYRLNYAGELPNAAIHSDMGWGTHALVLYLSDPPEPTGHGTAFWRHRETRATEIRPGDHDLFLKVKDDWNDSVSWEMRALVPMKFNRATVYPSALFHSRWPFPAFGTGPDDGRLIAVAFFSGVAP